MFSCLFWGRKYLYFSWGSKYLVQELSHDFLLLSYDLYQAYQVAHVFIQKRKPAQGGVKIQFFTLQSSAHYITCDYAHNDP